MADKWQTAIGAGSQTIDPAELGRTLADILKDAITGLVEGAQHDLALYANRMADDAMRVMALADAALRERLLTELMNQVRLIGEIHRLRAVQTAWEAVSKIFMTVVRTAIRFVVPVV